MLTGRRIVLGVTGGVAAYKAAYLARRLTEHGAAVRTIMTASARRFLGPQTLAAITGSPPVTDFFEGTDESPHTNLARWADLIVIAPATASSLSRLASGLSEDVLTGTVLAATCPVVVAPAMHTEMWEHAATQRNIAELRSDGVHVIGPDTGSLAGGDEGPGRLVEPEEIVASIVGILAGEMQGWSVLVSSGGTRETIDPVRFIGNRSSGKMGNAIANEAARRGARVVLVTSQPQGVDPAVEVVEVESAQEMADAVWDRASTADVAVLAAAVADFRPAAAAERKLKRQEGLPEFELEPTPDILAGVAGIETGRPFLVGFAAETGTLDDAIVKAKSKGVDLLVGNDISSEGSGFGSDTNEVVLITPDGETEPWPLMPKSEVAARLWDRVAEMRSAGGDAS
jgi:phosphopantothenoylcysteine decarboxylase/phosphopantothenate--cysteine ligase